MLANIVKYLLIIYQKVRPLFFGQCCRYHPTCSHYYQEAIDIHGLGKATYLALKRLIMCNQFFPGGYDPVPAKGIK
jgi:hypothetical protein